MTVQEIISSKIKDQVEYCGSGFSDVFNGKRVSTHTHFHLGLTSVSIEGFPCKGFDRFDSGGMIDYIIEATN